MSDPSQLPPGVTRVRVALLAALLVTGCAGRNRGSDASELLAAGWIDSDPMGAATEADPERLAALAGAGLKGRILRLDRLLDLYDAARFADDRQARESLWLALGGHASTRGIEASREAVLRLLDEAYAIEDLAARDPSELDEAELRFVSDAIMLLSTDMFLPDTAESLITATLAYRVLAEEGHPRIADNAHWRLYDHVRGVLEGAVEIAPAMRADVVVHALYAEREDISPWLEDLAPHARPPLPSPTELWALLEQHRDALAPIERWQPVLATRVEREANLKETVMALLPRPREPGWRLVELARGTAAPESLAPTVVLEPGRAQIEAREFEPGAIESAALEGLLARDGRGILLFASAPDVPAPEYAATLRALAQARTTTIELAVHEPALPQSDSEREPGMVVVALPLYVALPDDASAGARALRDSRIHIQLSGRGPRFRVDGRWLGASPTLPSDLVAFVDKLRRAYPRQHAVSLSLGDDVQHQQLVDLLAALTGGRSPAFVAVGWMPDATIEPAPPTDMLGERTLAARFELASDAIAIVLPEPAAGVPEQDWARLRTASESLRPCIPELEGPLPKSGLTVQLEFADHELVDLVASGGTRGRKPNAASLERFESCANDRLAGFRLREHAAALRVELLVRPRP